MAPIRDISIGACTEPRKEETMKKKIIVKEHLIKPSQLRDIIHVLKKKGIKLSMDDILDIYDAAGVVEKEIEDKYA
ncbi:hypothetical protein DRJ17_04670 [Candidatus Woesearchaeota archaeon]|nr:MAG: hypothetical protein DRJ17_04670 [Candidatus Woesearchaeota archaeon]